MLLLERDERAQQIVVLRIADLGGIENVVPVGVIPDLITQLLDLHMVHSSANSPATE